MAFNSSSLDDYIDVAERIAQAMAKWPDASFQNIGTKLVTVGTASFVEVSVALYRDPADIRPAIATAWEPLPGATPYTRNSEMMNAETSAMGRAVIAAGIPSKKVASREEVRNRQEGHSPTAPVSDPWNATAPQWGTTAGIMAQHPDAPSCTHGVMKEKRGISPTTKQPYFGFVCTAPREEQCTAIWWEVKPDGRYGPKE